jgi:predicted DNA-binding protein
MENKEKTFLVRLEKDLHEKYKNLCKQKGYNMSQQIRNFIKKQLQDNEQ